MVTTIYIRDDILAAVDRVVLRGQPADEDTTITVGDGITIETWPRQLCLGPHVLRLVSIYNKNGAQEAMYEKRC